MEKEPIFECLVAISHSESILLSHNNGTIEFTGWEVIFIKNHPTLVVISLPVSSRISYADGFFNKTGGIHCLSDHFNGSGGHLLSAP